MMNPQFRIGHVWILCLGLSLLYGTSMRGAQPDKEIDRLASAYRAAPTEFERRAVCLDAMDAGVVARGRSVAVVDAVFGTTYARKLPPTGSRFPAGVVEFHPLQPPPNEAYAAACVGWYLAFEFDSTGRLQNYYLSNKRPGKPGSEGCVRPLVKLIKFPSFRSGSLSAGSPLGKSACSG